MKSRKLLFVSICIVVYYRPLFHLLIIPGTSKLLCTRYRWYFVMGGAGRGREGLDVLVRLKDRGYWVNHPRPMGSSRGDALQSYKSLNFNFKLNSRAESSWVSALVLRSSFWNRKNHRPRFYNKLRIVYIHGSIIARDDSVTKQHVYISREISNFVTFACVSRTYFFHLRFNFEREIVKPKLKHQIKRKEKLKRIYPTPRSRLICGKLIKYSLFHLITCNLFGKHLQIE